MPKVLFMSLLCENLISKTVGIEIEKWIFREKMRNDAKRGGKDWEERTPGTGKVHMT